MLFVRTFCTAGNYPQGTAAQLAAGDLLFLYTDGIVEAGSTGSGGLFGIERTLDVLRAHRTETPDQILATIHRAASDCAPSCIQGDDMTAILVAVDAGMLFLLGRTAVRRLGESEEHDLLAGDRADIMVQA